MPTYELTIGTKTYSLPKTVAYAVTFKDEGGEGRSRFGPVYVFDAKVIEVPEGQDYRVDTVPFGEPFPGQVADLGWLTKAQAKKIAKFLNATFSES